MDWKFEKNMYPILDTRVELQIPYSICTKVQKKSVLWTEKSSNRKDFKTTV